jgi:hypothetical protein
MRRFDASGATVCEFCAREGLCESSFYRWRARMGSPTPSGRGALARPAGGRTLPEQPAAASFIDLGSLASARPDASNCLELRLDLGGGVVLQIVRR